MPEQLSSRLQSQNTKNYIPMANNEPERRTFQK